MTRPTLFLAAAVLAIASHNAAALELPQTVGVHLASLHGPGGHPPKDGWNPVNPGLYARWNSGLTIGAYYNSERHTSAYAAWTFSDAQDRFALTAGVVSGYRQGLFPLLVPSMRVAIDARTSARISLLAPPKGALTAHLSIERRF